MIVVSSAFQDILVPGLIVAAIGLFFAVLIVVVSRFFAVEENLRAVGIRELLPGANCGACGYSGCDGYAEALADGEPDITKCPVGGPSLVDDLSELLGITAVAATPTVAHVMCQGTTAHTQKRFAYSGTISCSAAHGLFSGPNSCTYGCIGFGDCVYHCPYGAIDLLDGVAVINENKCKACGLCVETCPKNLIFMIPKRPGATVVSCRNKWPGAQTRKNCSIGCIGCRRCHKVCEFGAITMDGPLAVIDQDKCTRCGKCVEVCPTHAIQTYFETAPRVAAAAEIAKSATL